LSSALTNTASFLIPVVILEKSLVKDLIDIIASFVDKGFDLPSCVAKSLCTFAFILVHSSVLSFILSIFAFLYACMKKRYEFIIDI
jgi:hypothetical protein